MSRGSLDRAGGGSRDAPIDLRRNVPPLGMASARMHNLSTKTHISDWNNESRPSWTGLSQVLGLLCNHAARYRWTAATPVPYNNNCRCRACKIFKKSAFLLLRPVGNCYPILTPHSTKHRHNTPIRDPGKRYQIFSCRIITEPRVWRVQRATGLPFCRIICRHYFSWESRIVPQATPPSLRDILY